MWELAICFDLEYEKSAIYIKKVLQKTFVNNTFICTIEKEKEECKLLLACSIDKKYKLNKLLDELLSDFFVNEYKENYLKKHLKLNRINKTEEEIFLKALVCFDLEYDKMLIKQKLNYDNTLYLKSFFAFKCKAVKSKWNDICELTNENASFLQAQHIFVELLKFLVENLKIHKNFVTCFYKNNQLKFLDENNKIIKLKINTNSKKEVELIRNLIRLNPKNICLHYDKSIPEETLKLLTKLFENRIKFYDSESKNV